MTYAAAVAKISTRLALTMRPITSTNMKLYKKIIINLAAVCWMKYSATTEVVGRRAEISKLTIYVQDLILRLL